jgi:hypothetical protein
VPLVVEGRPEFETGISLPVVALGWIVAGAASATAVMACALVDESAVESFAAGVEGVETGVDAVVDFVTGLLAMVAGVTDEFTVVLTVGAGLFAGAGVGAGAVKLAVVGAGAASGAARGAGVAAVAMGVGVAVVLTGIAVVLGVSGVAACAVVTAGASGSVAEPSVGVTREEIVDTVVVVEVVGTWLFVSGAAPRVVGCVVIAVTDGMFCVLCNCEAWSIAWIMMVAMSEPTETLDEALVLEVEVVGVVVAAAGMVLVALESRVRCVGALAACRICAASIVAIAEAVTLAVVKLVTVTGVALVPLVAVVGVAAFAEVFCAVEFFPLGVKESGP